MIKKYSTLPFLILTGMLSGSSANNWMECEPLRERECESESGCTWVYFHGRGGECFDVSHLPFVLRRNKQTPSVKGEALLRLEAAADDPNYDHHDDAHVPYYLERPNSNNPDNVHTHSEFESESGSGSTRTNLRGWKAGSGTGTGTGAGVGVYLQTEVTSKHGKRCRLPLPKCGDNSRCMERTEGKPICVDNNRCIPAGVLTGTGNRFRCCNGYSDGYVRGYIPAVVCL